MGRRKPPVDPRVDKRRVTMKTFTVLTDEKGQTVIEQVKTDYVRPDILDAYVVEARKHWQVVEVSDEPDAGPGGYDGQTHVPAELDHPLAGVTFAANPKED